MQDGSVSVTGVMASSNALHYCVCLLPGPGRQDGHGRMPAPKRHRGGACCRGLSLRQWMSWLRMRLQNVTLLWLPGQQDGLRRGLNGPSARGSGRMYLIIRLSGLRRLQLSCVGTLASLRRLGTLGDIAAERGRITKGAFVRWPMQLLLVTVRRG